MLGHLHTAKTLQTWLENAPFIDVCCSHPKSKLESNDLEKNDEKCVMMTYSPLDACSSYVWLTKDKHMSQRTKCIKCATCNLKRPWCSVHDALFWHATWPTCLHKKINHHEIWAVFKTSVGWWIFTTVFFPEFNHQYGDISGYIPNIWWLVDDWFGDCTTLYI